MRKAMTTKATITEDTDKRARFVEEYLVDFNATQAAKRAGYSPKTAYAQGSRLLKDAEIQRRLAAGRSRQRQRLEATQDNVVEQLRRIGFSDIRNIVRWQTAAMTEEEVDEDLEAKPRRGAPARARRVLSADVLLVDSDEIDDDTAAAISEISQGPNGLKVKLHDKMPALQALGKHLGMFKDEIQINGPVKFVIEGAPTQGSKS